MKLRFLSLALVAALGLAACGDDNDNNGPVPTGNLRAIHFSPDAPEVDILVDGAQVLANVAYTDASDYLEVPAGTRNVRVEAVGSDDAAIDADVPVADGVDYTVIAIDEVATIRPLYLVDDNTLPPAGQAKVRVIHGAPSAPAVDVYFTPTGLPFGVPSLTNFQFGDVSETQSGSNYITVPAGTYDVRVTVAGNPEAIAIEETIVVPANVVVTAIAGDTPGGGPPFGLQLYVDAGL